MNEQEQNLIDEGFTKEMVNRLKVKKSLYQTGQLNEETQEILRWRFIKWAVATNNAFTDDNYSKPDESNWLPEYIAKIESSSPQTNPAPEVTPTTTKPIAPKEGFEKMTQTIEPKITATRPKKISYSYISEEKAMELKVNKGFSDEDLAGIADLKRKVLQGKYSEDILDEKRLGFARWLWENNRITENYPTQPVDKSPQVPPYMGDLL